LWGRYAGSVESVLAQDMNIVESGEGVDGLIRLLRLNRGDLAIKPEDFWGWSTGARFYPLLYMLTRVNHAKDWGTGIKLDNLMLGHQSTLQVHHIFPKSLLYDKGYTKALVNALGNYAFLTSETNNKISNKKPCEYIPEYIALNPGAVESHWIPTDSSLLEVENYEIFLTKRRELLAESTNRFLDSLLTGSLEQVEIHEYTNRTENTVSYQDEDDILLDVNIWMIDKGLLEGDIHYELTDENGNQLMIIDLAWPHGIQLELSEPLALLINEGVENKEIVNRSGFRFFTNPDEFKGYIETHYAIN
jgi:hypothetical protein